MDTGQTSTTESVVVLAAKLAELTELLGSASWAGLDVDAQLAVIRSLEASARRVAALDVAVVAQAEQQNLAGRLVVSSTAALLSGLWNVPPRVARRRVTRATQLGPRLMVTGQVLGPLRPVLAPAHVAGLVDAAQVDVIVSMLSRLPASLPVELADFAEQDLTGHALRINAEQLAGYARGLRDALDPDGTLSDERDQQRRRFLTLTPQYDGMVAIRGLLDAATGAAAMAVFHSLAAPNTTGTATGKIDPAKTASSPAEESAGDDDSAGGPLAHDGVSDVDVGEVDQYSFASDPTTEDQSASDRPPMVAVPELVLVDDRSAAQRLHDALGQVCQRSLRAGELPGSGGIPATVLITMTAEQFETKTGLATTGYGQRLTVNQALRLADESAIAWIVHNSHGGVLDYGRTRRIASHGQTLALVARDKGCSFPGCTAPPHWTQRHHVRAWRHHGRTAVYNMALLCAVHHRRIDTEGWTMLMVNDVPHFVPPAWRDPTQTPIRNHAH
ncbi:MAG: endonuclease [Frankiales bacterium]|nr:endonuclease [Frankiales bacterium]